MRLLSIGEVLWDISEDGTMFIGGAPLNVAAHFRRLGGEALLFSVVGEDQRGLRALKEMEALNLSTALISRHPHLPTGTALVLRDGGFCIARPAAFDALSLDEGALQRIQAFAPDWIYFGTLAQTTPETHSITETILSILPHAKCIYDVNLREGHWNLALVKKLCHMATRVKLNESEAQILHKFTRGTPFDLEIFCKTWCTEHQIDLLCVTMGHLGCVLYSDGEFSHFPAYPVEVVDTVGAGDAFVAALLYGFGESWPLEQASRMANAVAAVVASRAGATSLWSLAECERLMENFTSSLPRSS